MKQRPDYGTWILAITITAVLVAATIVGLRWQEHRVRQGCIEGTITDASICAEYKYDKEG